MICECQSLDGNDEDGDNDVDDEYQWRLKETTICKPDICCNMGTCIVGQTKSIELWLKYVCMLRFLVDLLHLLLTVTLNFVAIVAVVSIVAVVANSYMCCQQLHVLSLLQLFP